MRRLGMTVGIFILFLPLLFVCWLFAAAQWARMDATTLRMPEAARDLVSSVAMQKVGNSRDQLGALHRVLRLNPEEPDAWTWLCAGFINGKQQTADVETCSKALTFQRTSGNYNGLGRAQERLGDECKAEDSYTKAAGEEASSGSYDSVERMGRAALRCGDLYGSRAGLEAAISMQDKLLKDPDEDDDEITDIKKDRLADNEYLAVTLDRLKLPKLSQQACTEAHPASEECACTLDANGTATCR
jgi:tetratricopeptide (TPR) repeat protein